MTKPFLTQISCCLAEMTLKRQNNPIFFNIKHKTTRPCATQNVSMQQQQNKMTAIISASIAVENGDRPAFRVSVESPFKSFHWCKWKDALHINLLILYSLILGSGARKRIMIMLVNTGHSAWRCWHTHTHVHTHTHFHSHIHIHQCTQMHGTCMHKHITQSPKHTPLPCELHALWYADIQQHNNTQTHRHTHTHNGRPNTSHLYSFARFTTLKH